MIQAFLWTVFGFIMFCCGCFIMLHSTGVSMYLHAGMAGFSTWVSGFIAYYEYLQGRGRE